MPHAGQPQSGINPHLAPPGHQHSPQLHTPLNPLPPTPQFQDLSAPPFLPQALHQQYLLQQQILETQHRRIMPPSRYGDLVSGYARHSHSNLGTSISYRKVKVCMNNYSIFEM